MSDFNYMQKQVALDRRLEEVMESHRTEPTKEAEEDTSSGLQGFVSRRTIAEEISALPKTAVDLNVERAREKIAGILEEKASPFDGFLEAVKTAAEAEEAASQDASELASLTETLRGEAHNRTTR